MDREEGVAELRALVVKLRDELSGVAGVGRLDRSKCETLESFSEQGRKICNEFRLDELFSCKIVLSPDVLGYRGREKAGGLILQIIVRIPPSEEQDYVMPTMRRFCVPIESDSRDEVVSQSQDAMTVLENLLRWFNEMEPEWVREEGWSDCHVGEMEPELVSEKVCAEGSVGGNKTSDMIRTLRSKLSALKAPVTAEEGWLELVGEFETIRRRGLREWANEYLKVELGGGSYEEDFFQHAVKYTWRDPDEKDAETVEGGFVLSELMTYWRRNHVMETIDRFVGYLGRLENFARSHEGEKNPKEAAEDRAGCGGGPSEKVKNQLDHCDTIEREGAGGRKAGKKRGPKPKKLSADERQVLEMHLLKHSSHSVIDDRMITDSECDDWEYGDAKKTLDKLRARARRRGLELPDLLSTKRQNTTKPTE